MAVDKVIAVGLLFTGPRCISIRQPAGRPKVGSLYYSWQFITCQLSLTSLMSTPHNRLRCR